MVVAGFHALRPLLEVYLGTVGGVPHLYAWLYARPLVLCRDGIFNLCMVAPSVAKISPSLAVSGLPDRAFQETKSRALLSRLCHGLSRVKPRPLS